MNHVMLDLETLGTIPGCCILSIGAVIFDPRGGPDLDKTFYKVLSIDHQKEVGLFEDPNTVRWWQNQKKEAWEAATKNPEEPTSVLREFNKWFASNRGSFLWAQGSNFDPVLLESVYMKFEIPFPWKFYNTRDTRTVYQMCKVPKDAIKREGTHHNALDDAVHQSKMIAWGVNRIKLAAV